MCRSSAQLPGSAGLDAVHYDAPGGLPRPCAGTCNQSRAARGVKPQGDVAAVSFATALKRHSPSAQRHVPL